MFLIKEDIHIKIIAELIEVETIRYIIKILKQIFGKKIYPLPMF